MESLEIKGANMPMHTLTPETKLDVVKMIMNYLITVIGVDVAKNPLKVARVEQMIDESARRLTPVDIKKAFDMYVKGELQGLEPISGLLDSILFNKVINQFKQQQKTKHTPPELVLSDDDKKTNAFLNCVYAFDDWVAKREVPYEYHTAYDELKSRGLIGDISKKESDNILKLAKSRMIREAATNRQFKDSLREVLNTPKERSWAINYGKCELLANFFSGIHAKKQHIKDLL